MNSTALSVLAFEIVFVNSVTEEQFVPMYFFYIVRCADNSLYCGQTNNLDRRIKEHNTDNSRSAKYTKSRRPVSLVYHEEYQTIQEALKRERGVKTWPKSRKELLVNGLLEVSATYTISVA